MAYWEYLWLKLAIDSEKSYWVRVVETSKRLAWTAYGKPYVFDAIPQGGTLTATEGGLLQSSDEPARTPLPSYAWAPCLDALGSDGWELVSVTSLSGDVRVRRFETSPGNELAGHHDVQLWLFKRQRDYQELPEEDAEPVADSE